MKGQPTPKAPQNRPKAPVERAELTMIEKHALAQVKARKAIRRQVAQLRSMTKGIVPLRVAFTLNAEAMKMRAYRRIEAGRYARQDAAEAMAERYASDLDREMRATYLAERTAQAIS